MSVTWTKTTEEHYYEMLGVLPPAAMGAMASFQVGEASNHRNGRPTFASFKMDDAGNYYESAEPLTFREFSAEVGKAEYYYD